MSDNVSLIDAIKLVAKATRDDAAKVSDMVKGALRPEQIDDMRLMLSRARDGSLAATASASAAATSAAAPTAKAGPADTSSTATARGERATSLHRRVWKGANKASAKFQGVPLRTGSILLPQQAAESERKNASSRYLPLTRRWPL